MKNKFEEMKRKLCAEVYVGRNQLYFAVDRLPSIDDKLPQSVREGF